MAMPTLGKKWEDQYNAGTLYQLLTDIGATPVGPVTPLTSPEHAKIDDYRRTELFRLVDELGPDGRPLLLECARLIENLVGHGIAH